MMKKFIIRTLLFIAPIITISGFVLFSPYDREFAFNYVRKDNDFHNSSWMYNKIFVDTSSIDAVFIGSSRTLNAVNDEYINKEFSKSKHQLNNIAAMGYYRPGRNVYYVLAKDILKYKQPKYLIIEVRLAESRFSHITFPVVAEARDIVYAPLFINHDYFPDLLYGLKMRYLYHREKLYPTLTIKAVEWPNKAYGWIPYNRVENPAKLTRLKARAWYRHGPVNEKSSSKYIRKIESLYAKQYLKKIYTLTKEANCKLVFLYLPSYGSNGIEPKERAIYERLGELWIPPIELFIDPAVYGDNNHLNLEGSDRLTKWLIKKLDEE
ncbi:MAG: hypothetical protein IIA45_15760 [Bacteroidetes bacterium]|nr:hypothetical protein [Bacteroidota bacterium]